MISRSRLRGWNAAMPEEMRQRRGSGLQRKRRFYAEELAQHSGERLSPSASSLSNQTLAASTLRYLPFSISRIRFDHLSLDSVHLTFSFSSSKALNAMGQTPMLLRIPQSLEVKCGFSR